MMLSKQHVKFFDKVNLKQITLFRTNVEFFN